MHVAFDAKHTKVILDLSFLDRIWSIILDHLRKIYASLAASLFLEGQSNIRLIPILTVLCSYWLQKQWEWASERKFVRSHGKGCFRCFNSQRNVRSFTRLHVGARLSHPQAPLPRATIALLNGFTIEFASDFLYCTTSDGGCDFRRAQCVSGHHQFVARK